MADIVPREFIDLLLAKIDLVDLINTQIPLRKKSSNNYFACCPFHTEKSASFSVSQPKQFYYCFGCGATGNAIDFLMQHDRMSFPEAIDALARTTGMEVPRSSHAAKSNKDEMLPLYDLMQEVAQYYYEQLRTSPRVIDYLKGRGIAGNIAKQFCIGFAASGWSHLFDQFGKTDTDKKKLLDTGLIIKKQEGGYYDRFRDRVMFPIHDARGRIIGFGGRIIDQGEPKYLNSPETPIFQKGHELYGLYQTNQANRKVDRILIVEGYMDVIALFQHGIQYAVATLGTATTAHHIQRLYRYTAEIVFCFDGDQAGRTAAWRALEVIFPIMHDDLQVRFLFLPDGEDPDSIVRKEGKEAFEKRISTALSLSTFFFQTMSSQCDIGTMEGRARFASLSLNHIKQVTAEILQGILLEELSKRARVDLNGLKQQVKSKEPSKPTDHTSAPLKAETPVQTKLPSSIRLALALLIQHPHLAIALPQPLPDCSLPGFTLLTRLLEIIRSNPTISTGMLLEHWRGQKEGALIAKLAQDEHMMPEAGMENELLGTIRQIISQDLDAEINRLLAKAAQNGLSDEEKVALTTCIAKKKNLTH